MKKLFSIFAIFCFAFSFSQIKIDLTKKQAYERFKNSNVRKACSIKLNEFNDIWKNLTDITNYENEKEIKLKELLIFNSVKEKNKLKKISNCYFAGSIPARPDGTPRCDDCSMIIYGSEKEIENWKPWTY